MKKKIQEELIIASGIFIFLIAGFFISGLYVIWEDSVQLPCDKLPTLQEANHILAQHEDVKKQVEEIFYTMDMDTFRCPGKMELVINYQTGLDRAKIKNLIGNSFFGIPYRMSNN